jgi:hypothetical protein
VICRTFLITQTYSRGSRIDVIVLGDPRSEHATATAILDAFALLAGL